MDNFTSKIKLFKNDPSVKKVLTILYDSNDMQTSLSEYSKTILADNKIDKNDILPIGLFIIEFMDTVPEVYNHFTAESAEKILKVIVWDLLEKNDLLKNLNATDIAALEQNLDMVIKLTTNKLISKFVGTIKKLFKKCSCK